MDQVHVGHFTAIVYRSPGTSNGGQIRRDHPRLARGFKRFFEEGRKHLVFLPIGLNLPFARGPIRIGLRVRAHLFHELCFVDPCHMEHDAGGLQLFPGWVRHRSAGAVRDVCIARGVDHDLSKNSFTSRLGFGDNPGDPVTFHNGCHKQAMQHGHDAGLFDQLISNHFEAFAVELITE